MILDKTPVILVKVIYCDRRVIETLHLICIFLDRLFFSRDGA